MKDEKNSPQPYSEPKRKHKNFIEGVRSIFHEKKMILKKQKIKAIYVVHNKLKIKKTGQKSSR